MYFLVIPHVLFLEGAPTHAREKEEERQKLAALCLAKTKTRQTKKRTTAAAVRICATRLSCSWLILRSLFFFFC